MNKVELAEELATELGLRKKDSIEIVEGLITIIIKTLSKGEKVQLIPFGIFEIKERKARKGRNPRSGEEITIEKRRAATFRSGKALKEAIRG